MFKVAAKFVHVTNDGVRVARRAVGTYTRYAYFSLTDRKGRQHGEGSLKNIRPYEPKYDLEYDSPEDYLLSQWSTNPWPYLYYRVLMACYFVFMVFYTAIVGTLKAKMLIMLTYWSFYILTACQILRAVNVWHYIQLKNCNHDIQEKLKGSRRIKCQWLLYNLSAGSAPIVTFLFWTIAYDGSGVTFINCSTHGANAAAVFLDLWITRMPMRMLHMVHGVAFGLVYSAFSVCYWYLGGTNQYGEPFIYKVLNYGESPLKAVYYIVAISFIVAPVIHSMFFLLYRLRVFLHRFLKVMDKRHKCDTDIKEN